jgi:hypothetical protein
VNGYRDRQSPDEAGVVVPKSALPLAPVARARSTFECAPMIRLNTLPEPADGSFVSETPLLSKRQPDGTRVLSLVTNRTVWFCVALLIAVLSLAMVLSTKIESQSGAFGVEYRVEWSCPTFGESSVKVTGDLPVSKQLVNPCESEAGSRRLVVLLGVPGCLLIAVALFTRRRRITNAPPAESNVEPGRAEDESPMPGTSVDAR